MKLFIEPIQKMTSYNTNGQFTDLIISGRPVYNLYFNYPMVGQYDVIFTSHYKKLQK